MDLGIDGIGQAEKIGSGGTATIYRARQERLGRDVAVKVLLSNDDRFVRRFAREARTLGRLSRHPGIVTVYDTGLTADNRPYLLLELCSASLLDRLRVEKRLAPDVACRYIAVVANAVAAAHKLGVVHRDLKPGNILLADDGKPLISDFGISMVLDTTFGETTAVGFTPGYVAPETIAGKGGDMASDVYALGATLFHLLSGKPPFLDQLADGTNLLALAAAVANDPVPDLRPGVPDELCAVIEWTMAKDPAVRPDAAGLSRHLVAVLRGRPRPIPTAVPTPAVGAAGRPGPARTAGLGPTPPSDAAQRAAATPIDMETSMETMVRPPVPLPTDELIDERLGRPSPNGDAGPREQAGGDPDDRSGSAPAGEGPDGDEPVSRDRAVDEQPSDGDPTGGDPASGDPAGASAAPDRHAEAVPADEPVDGDGDPATDRPSPGEGSPGEGSSDEDPAAHDEAADTDAIVDEAEDLDDGDVVDRWLQGVLTPDPMDLPGLTSTNGADLAFAPPGPLEDDEVEQAAAGDELESVSRAAGAGALAYWDQAREALSSEPESSTRAFELRRLALIGGLVLGTAALVLVLALWLVGLGDDDGPGSVAADGTEPSTLGRSDGTEPGADTGPGGTSEGDADALLPAGASRSTRPGPTGSRAGSTPRSSPSCSASSATRWLSPSPTSSRPKTSIGRWPTATSATGPTDGIPATVACRSRPPARSRRPMSCWWWSGS